MKTNIYSMDCKDYGVRVEIRMSDKTWVDQMLALNTHNRNPKSSHLDALYADMIVPGKYLLTAQGIAISSAGVLLDGQHRLLANRLAGYPPLPFLVVHGLPPESQLVVDRHAKRNMADALALYFNQTVSNRFVAVLNLFHRVPGITQRNGSFVWVTARSPTAQELAETAPEWHEYVPISSALGDYYPASVHAVFMAYAKIYNVGAATALATQVNTGVQLTEDSPAYRLREFFARFRVSSSETKMKAVRVSASVCILHARGETCMAIRESLSWERLPKTLWRCDERQILKEGAVL